MAVLLTNSNEGITPSGTTVTIGNSGGASGNAWDATSIGVGATDASDSAHAAHGALGNQLATAGTAGTSYNKWTTSAGSITQHWFREYLYFTANPAASHRVYSVFQTATLCAAVRLGTSGTITFLDSAGVAIVGCTTTNSIPLNKWFRIEGFIIGDVAVGQVELKLFSNADDIAPLETVTSAATQALTGAPNDYRFGMGSSLANVGPFWMDDVGLSDTGYLGPVAVASAAGIGTAQPGRTWLRRFHHRQTLLPPPAPAPTAAAVVVEFTRPAQQPTRPAVRGRFWGPTQLGGQTNAPRASWLQQRRGIVPQARGRYWAPRSAGQANVPVSSWMRGRARLTVNRAGKWWQPVPAPPAAVARVVASFLRQRRGTVPQGRGRWWAPRSQGQVNAPRASFLQGRARPLVNKASRYWTAPPSAPPVQVQPPRTFLRQRTPPPAAARRGRFWPRIYPAATPAVSKPVASFLRGRGRTLINKAGRFWFPSGARPGREITIIADLTATRYASEDVTSTRYGADLTASRYGGGDVTAARYAADLTAIRYSSDVGGYE
jgi:hypothetical protein